MPVLEWKERTFIEKVNSWCFCWFPAAIMVHQNGTPIWLLHTKLYKDAWNVSANNSAWTVGHKDLRLGQIVYTLVFYNISFSWLLPLEDFQFLFFVAWQWKRSIRHFCSHRREPLTWHMQGRILTEKSGTAEPSMFQGVSLKLRISLSCLRFFFNQRKIRTNCFFGVTGVGPFSVSISCKTP